MVLNSLMIERDGVRFPKCQNDYNHCDLELISKNYKAINLLYCNLNGDEFERIFTSTSAHVIWNKPIVTYERISQFK